MLIFLIRLTGLKAKNIYQSVNDTLQPEKYFLFIQEITKAPFQSKYAKRRNDSPWHIRNIYNLHKTAGNGNYVIIKPAGTNNFKEQINK